MFRPAVFVRLNEAHKVWFTEFPENKPVIAAEQQTKVVGVNASITAALDGRWRFFLGSGPECAPETWAGIRGRLSSIDGHHDRGEGIDEKTKEAEKKEKR